MNEYAAVENLLATHDARLVRHSKHEVWALPNGGVFVRASTPSDRRAAMNQLSDLRRALGIANIGSGEGERREKRQGKRQRGPGSLDTSATFNSALADGLRLVGAVEADLRGRVDDLERECEVLSAALGEMADASALALEYVAALAAWMQGEEVWNIYAALAGEPAAFERGCNEVTG